MYSLRRWLDIRCFLVCVCSGLHSYGFFFLFFKQKTAYEMRISDWSSDVCSSDLRSPVASNLPVLLSCSLIDAESAPPDCNVPLLVTLAALRVTRPGPSDPISVPLLMSVPTSMLEPVSAWSVPL